MRNRFKIKLMNAARELESLSEFIEVNNLDYGSKGHAKTKRANIQIDEMAAKLRNMESQADKMLFVEY